MAALFLLPFLTLQRCRSQTYKNLAANFTFEAVGFHQRLSKLVRGSIIPGISASPNLKVPAAVPLERQKVLLWELQISEPGTSACRPSFPLQ